MADSKITALASISTSTDPAVDPLVIVDVSDTSMAATGTTKKVTLNNLLSSSPTATGALTVTGLVTAGSSTITGDLTVDTNTLFVNSTTDRVGIATASPAEKLTIDNTLGAGAIGLRVFANDQSTARMGVHNTNGQSWQFVAGYAGANNQGLSIFDATTSANRLYLDTSGNANIINGNLILGTSGKGIDFSATANSSGTMTSELLNDYEEGTFTPTISSGATIVTYGNQSGRYTKVGRLVSIFVSISTTIATRNGSQFIISGLPFASADFGSGAIAFNNTGFVATAAGNKPNLYASGSTVEFYTSSGTSFTGSLIAADAFDVRFSATYFV